ncbi:SPASM domain-containing protein [Bacteroidota bacterium]
MSTYWKKTDLPGGAIYVITSKALDKPLEIFHYLTNMQSGPCFNVVKIFEEDPLGMYITPEQHAHWLGAIFPEWYKARERYGPIKPFYNYLRCLEGKGATIGCEDSGSCAYNWVYVGPKGNTSHCGRSGDYDLLSYGSIYDHSLEEIFTDEQRALLDKRNEVLAEDECKDCNLWRICHGGCPLDAFIEKGDFLHRHPNCVDKKILFKEYIEPVTGLKADFGIKPPVS